jgi:hypothetical protein
METSERHIFFKSIPFSSVFSDTLRILEQHDLNVSETSYDSGLIRAKVTPIDPSEDVQVIAKFWKGKNRILIGLRGSVSGKLSEAGELNKKLKRLEKDLRQLDYAY